MFCITTISIFVKFNTWLSLQTSTQAYSSPIISEITCLDHQAHAVNTDNIQSSVCGCALHIFLTDLEFISPVKIDSFAFSFTSTWSLCCECYKIKTITDWKFSMENNTSALHSECPVFNPWDYLSRLRFLWFSSVPLGNCWDSTLNPAMTTSFLTLFNFIFINCPTIQCYTVFAIDKIAEQTINEIKWTPINSLHWLIVEICNWQVYFYEQSLQ
jgi:hypothetical protein